VATSCQYVPPVTSGGHAPWRGYGPRRQDRWETSVIQESLIWRSPGLFAVSELLVDTDPVDEVGIREAGRVLDQLCGSSSGRVLPMGGRRCPQRTDEVAVIRWAITHPPLLGLPPV
jgi:hypothetical protein